MAAMTLSNDWRYNGYLIISFNQKLCVVTTSNMYSSTYKLEPQNWASTRVRMTVKGYQPKTSKIQTMVHVFEAICQKKFEWWPVSGLCRKETTPGYPYLCESGTKNSIFTLGSKEGSKVMVWRVNIPVWSELDEWYIVLWPKHGPVSKQILKAGMLLSRKTSRMSRII